MDVFADHESSVHPINVPRSWIWSVEKRTAYFGTARTIILKVAPTNASVSTPMTYVHIWPHQFGYHTKHKNNGYITRRTPNSSIGSVPIMWREFPCTTYTNPYRSVGFVSFV
ncbi:hypothetical protein ACE6H2_010903 [Prunus campanulata]